MIKKGIFLLGLTGLAISSCIEHEVIPPPEPKVELECRFEGTIGGAFKEYVENVDDYSCSAGLAKQTLAGVTNAQYTCAMTSTGNPQYVRVALGSLTWNDPTGTSTPSLTLFNSFFQANKTPDFSNDAMAGFEFRFQDQFGDVWKSYKDSIPEDVEFTGVVQESDNNGDYSKFVCEFHCPIYHIYSVVDNSVVPQTTPPTMKDSVAKMMVEDAKMTGYFRR